jgi:hypothetical protein
MVGCVYICVSKLDVGTTQQCVGSQKGFMFFRLCLFQLKLTSGLRGTRMHHITAGEFYFSFILHHSITCILF